MPEFTGFSKKSVQFLQALNNNNNRPWFTENKDDYESLIREPTLDFIATMNEPLHKLTPYFLAEPKKVGGSMMRPYRDTRFSKDKTPYKTNIGIQFRHVGGKNVHAPGFYVHIEAKESFIGIGLWKPESDQLLAIRERISENFSRWTSIVENFRNSGFELTGESLMRPPRNFTQDDPAIEDLKRKSFLIIKSFDNEELYSATLVKKVQKDFEQGSEFIRFLCNAVNVNY